MKQALLSVIAVLFTTVVCFAEHNGAVTGGGRAIAPLTEEEERRAIEEEIKQLKELGDLQEDVEELLRQLNESGERKVGENAPTSRSVAPNQP